MAEKKKWAPTKMFLQWCLSYLLISVIALTLLLASGYRYLDVLRDNLEYTNGIQLDMTRVWLDQKVKLLRKRRPFAEGLDEWRRYLQHVNRNEKRYGLLEFVLDNTEEQFLEDAAQWKRLLQETAMN